MRQFDPITAIKTHFARVLIVVLVIWAVTTTVYTVPAESVSVIRRFGKALKDTAQPGLHFKLPFGIDRVNIVPVQRQLKQEFGFQSNPNVNQEPDGLQSESYWNSSFTSLRARSVMDADQQRSMVTGDLNAVLVDWVVQYRIQDPHLYLFHVNEPVKTLRDLSEAVMREVIGDRTVDEVITIGRQEIETTAKEKLIELVKIYELGVVIDQIQLKDIDPPVPVQDSFDEVNKAQQDRENLINIANGEYNKVVPRARGLADQQIQAAEGYKIKRINEARGDVASFKAQFEEYLKAPEITRARLYLETIGEVFQQAGPKVILDSKIQQIYPFIQSINPGATATPAQVPQKLPVTNSNTTGRTR